MVFPAENGKFAWLHFHLFLCFNKRSYLKTGSFIRSCWILATSYDAWPYFSMSSYLMHLVFPHPAMSLQRLSNEIFLTVAHVCQHLLSVAFSNIYLITCLIGGEDVMRAANTNALMVGAKTDVTDLTLPNLTPPSHLFLHQPLMRWS